MVAVGIPGTSFPIISKPAFFQSIAYMRPSQPRRYERQAAPAFIVGWSGPMTSRGTNVVALSNSKTRSSIEEKFVRKARFSSHKKWMLSIGKPAPNHYSFVLSHRISQGKVHWPFSSISKVHVEYDEGSLVFGKFS